MNEMICRSCKHWGYFNGKPMDSTGHSKCLLRKHKTHACSYCMKWEHVKKVGKQE